MSAKNSELYSASGVASPALSRGGVLLDWRPEDLHFWSGHGMTVARRNLWTSIPALFLAFAVWQVWSVVAVNLPQMGFTFSPNQLFWLTAAPALSGATLRIFYSFMVPIFGGRRWTAISTASLLIPMLGLGFAVQDTTTSYSTMMILALLCGLGGANFSSSMANISFFYPGGQKGAALGLNAGLGNLGVSAVQLLSPLVMSVGLFGALGGASVMVGGQNLWPQNAAFVWVPFIAVSALAAWFLMNDISSARASFAAQAAIFKNKHNWLMCVLYLGTFGSFIGFSAGFPLLIKGQFPGVNPLAWAWMGPLIGALVRPIGGWLADRFNGASVTIWSYFVMAVAAMSVLIFLPKTGGFALPFGAQEGNFAGFFAVFLLLFLASGIGNGSTYRMIPVIFLKLNQRRAGQSQASQQEATRKGNTEGAAAIGFAGAMGAYGGFFIPRSYGTSIVTTGGPELAFWIFTSFYLMCIALTWWYYARRNAEVEC